MRKIFALVALLTMGMVAAHADCQDGPYGLKINGSKVVDAPKFGDPDAQGRVQYKASCVELAAGDEIQLINQSCDATWMVDLDPYGSYQNFEGGKSANKLTCKVAGSYDFYIKMKENDDLVYVGPGENCGGGGGGGEGGGGSDPSGYKFYAIGWINGADAGETAYDTYDDKYLFKDGKLTIECTMGSYIAIKDDYCNYYYFHGSENATGNKVTLEWASGWSPCYKWAILEGTQYIIMRSVEFKGNIELESVDKATYDAYHLDLEGIENTVVTEKAHKVFVDGQLRIVRGDRMFDLTGREVF